MEYQIIDLETGEIKEFRTDKLLTLEKGQAYLEVGKEEYNAQRKIIRPVTRPLTYTQKLLQRVAALEEEVANLKNTIS